MKGRYLILLTIPNILIWSVIGMLVLWLTEIFILSSMITFVGAFCTGMLIGYKLAENTDKYGF